MSTYLQYGQLPYSYINGFGLAFNTTNPSSMLDVTSGTCVDSTNTFQIMDTLGYTASSHTTGINGLDEGEVQIYSLYYVYIVWSITNRHDAGLLLSLNEVPVLPVGYGAYRLIGYVHTDDLGDFYNGYWGTANGASTRTFFYNYAPQTSITGTDTSFTTVELDPYVPSVDGIIVNFSTYLLSSAANDTLQMTTNSTIGGLMYITSVQVADVGTNGNATMPSRLVGGVPTVSYRVTGSGDPSAIIYVAGYTFTL